MYEMGRTLSPGESPRGSPARPQGFPPAIPIGIETMVGDRNRALRVEKKDIFAFCDQGHMPEGVGAGAAPWGLTSEWSAKPSWVCSAPQHVQVPTSETRKRTEVVPGTG